MSHPSLKHKSCGEKRDYERLEFLGDSVLNLLISEAIFKKFPDYPEGKLAKIRAYLVCKDTIGKVGDSMQIADFILMSQGEELSGGRLNKNNVENAIEAIIGAIYLDGGILECSSVIDSLWGSFLSQEANFDEIDPKTSLQEWAQGNGMVAPTYELIAKAGVDHSPIFKVMVSVGGKYKEYGSGKSIKLAQKDAAVSLLSKVK